jgi:hypothetical protein
LIHISKDGRLQREFLRDHAADYRYFPRETVRMDLLLGTILHSVSQRSRLAKPET